jgi:hypothetical protein
MRGFNDKKKHHFSGHATPLMVLGTELHAARMEERQPNIMPAMASAAADYCWDRMVSFASHWPQLRRHRKALDYYGRWQAICNRIVDGTFVLTTPPDRQPAVDPRKGTYAETDF